MADYWGIGKATRAMLPMVAVPTTAGTGSEAQSFALISDPVTHRKMACGDRRACCRVAILDPELTLTLPHSVTAATGMDAISHAVESFVTTRRTPISQAFSREAWRLLAGSFPTVLLRPDDIGARGSMLLGACLAGFAIENSMLGATHSLANPLTAEFGVPHGIAIGLMLPHVVRFNAQVVNGDFAELAALVPASPGSGSGAERVARCVEELRTAAGMPARLRECGVEEGRLSALSASAAAEWTARHNPRPVGPSDLEELYRCAY
jgi:alcohol dehydrogenase